MATKWSLSAKHLIRPIFPAFHSNVAKTSSPYCRCAKSLSRPQSIAAGFRPRVRKEMSHDRLDVVYLGGHPFDDVALAGLIDVDSLAVDVLVACFHNLPVHF